MLVEVEAALRDARGYAEVRVRRITVTTILFRGRDLRFATTTVVSGGAARALAPGGGWATVGFTGTEGLPARVGRAIELSSSMTGGEPLFPVPIRQHERRLPGAEEPSGTALSVKRAWLEAATAALLAADRRIVDSRTRYRDVVTETWYANTEGSRLSDRRAETGVAALAVAEEDGALERALESYAAPGGFAAIEAHAPLVRLAAERAVERLHAKPATRGRYVVVLDPRAAGALIHRALAARSVASGPTGESEPLAIGTRVGPECLTIGDDPSAAGLRTTTVLDDEGTPAANALLIQSGVVVGHLGSRDSVAGSGRTPTGHAFGGLRDAPTARLTNTYLASGRGGDDLLSGVAIGIYAADVLGIRLSGDQVSLEPARAYLIRHGKLAEPVKCPPIVGSIWSLFGRLETVGQDFSWDSADAGWLDEGSGGRSLTIGAPHARFVDLSLGETIG